MDSAFSKRFVSIEPINKGWSDDKKYCAIDADGIKYLLRVSPTSRHESRNRLFGLMQEVAALGVPMCLPIDFGTCDDGVYHIHSWIDGEDLGQKLPQLSKSEQYALGVKSGQFLEKIHTLSAPKEQEDWAIHFNRKVDRNIAKYMECGFKFDGDHHILNYLEQNRHLLEGRPQCFHHGDYHVGNMMLEQGKLMIIDFDRYDFGDPWDEFNRIVWSVAASPYFASGQLMGYFGGKPPLAFFRLLAYYIVSNTMASIPWAIAYGQDEIDTMLKQSQDVLAWFDNMKNPIPTWFKENE